MCFDRDIGPVFMGVIIASLLFPFFFLSVLSYYGFSF